MVGIPDLRPWLIASRPLAQINVAVPLLFGQSVAWATHGVFSWGWFAYLALFGVLDQLFIVFANDYADRHMDSAHRTPFSGGSGVLQSGTITPKALQRAAICMAIALIAWGFAVMDRRPMLLVCAVAAIALLHAYSFAPLRLSVRGGGEWLQAAGVGVVLPYASYYAQSSRLDFPVWALATTALTGLAGGLLTAVPDIETDTRSRKRSAAVRYGERNTIILFAGLLGASSAVLLISCSIPFSWACFLAAATTVVAVSAAVVGTTLPQRAKARLGFVMLGGAAQHGILIGWAAALIMAGR